MNHILYGPRGEGVLYVLESGGGWSGGVIVPRGSRTRSTRFGWWVREPGDVWRLHRP